MPPRLRQAPALSLGESFVDRHAIAHRQTIRLIGEADHRDELGELRLAHALRPRRGFCEAMQWGQLLVTLTAR